MNDDEAEDFVSNSVYEIETAIDRFILAELILELKRVGIPIDTDRIKERALTAISGITGELEQEPFSEWANNLCKNVVDTIIE